MCGFCNEIVKLVTTNFATDYPNDFPADTFIVSKTNIADGTTEYGIWCETGDFYHDGIYVENIKFCPICGRKLESG